MAYHLKEQKLIPGGLNLAAPSDQVAEGDCLELRGWWAAAMGKLEQAPAAVVRSNASGLMPGMPVTSLCQVANRTYYGSATGELRQILRAGEAAIDSGYDSSPLGMLSYQGYCWIMNRSKQRKDDGTAVSDWTPAAPGVPALTNPALASAALTITELDPANPDATSGDFTMIRMWTSSSIAGLEVNGLMTINTGGAAANFDGTWQVTAIYDGSPASLIEMRATVPAGTAFSVAGGMTATFANPSVPMGDYQYWVTWAYTDLGESNPSSTAGVITAATQNVPASGTKITVSIAALTPPTGAVYWNVYRKGPGMPSAYRVNVDRIPVATTSYDDFGDVAHSQDNDYLMDSLGILMEGDHDPAPACKVIANQAYNGRILVASSAAYPNRIWYTPALQPGFFRGSGNPQAGDWVDVGTDRGDEVLAITVRTGMVIIYRSRSIWRHVGDFGEPNARLECVVPDLGTVGVHGVVSTSLGDYFISNDGVYHFNGDWAKKISQKVEPIFRGLALEYLQTMTSVVRTNCAIGYRNGRLWVAYIGQAGNRTLIYHVETERWFHDGNAYWAFLDAGPQFLGSGGSAFLGAEYAVVALEDSYSHDATLIEYASEYQDCGLPDRKKTFADLVLTHNTQGEVLTVAVRTDRGGVASEITLRTIQSYSLRREVIPIVTNPHPLGLDQPETGPGITAYNLSIYIYGQGNVGTPPVEIYTPILLHYYVEARQGKRFDTSVTDHGIQEVKIVDQVELDIDTTDGPALLQVSSDIPGRTMAARLGGGQTVAETEGREARQLVLTEPVIGRLLRYQVDINSNFPNLGFQVYGARARVLPIGVYLDGTVGDFWAPQPISIGV